MASLILTISYKKNSGIVFSAQDIKVLYFTGIPLQDQFGVPIPDEQIDFFIEAAQKEIQDILAVKLTRQAYRQSCDFFHDEFMKWAYTPVMYPVVTPKKLQGYINSSLQVDYPEAWLSSKRQTGEEDLYHRTINLVPINSALNNSLSGTAVYVGVAPFIGFFGNRTIPNYWEATYITGFQKVPADILNVIGKKAAINILTQLGDILYGAGVANKSIGLDGLSQSLGTTSSATFALFSARIKQYENEIKNSMPNLKNRYKGISFGCL